MGHQPVFVMDSRLRGNAVSHDERLTLSRVFHPGVAHTLSCMHALRAWTTERPPPATLFLHMMPPLTGIGSLRSSLFPRLAPWAT